jgi:hypothetical protein
LADVHLAGVLHHDDRRIAAETLQLPDGSHLDSGEAVWAAHLAQGVRGLDIPAYRGFCSKAADLKALTASQWVRGTRF